MSVRFVVTHSSGRAISRFARDPCTHFLDQRGEHHFREPQGPPPPWATHGLKISHNHPPLLACDIKIKVKINGSKQSNAAESATPPTPPRPPMPPRPPSAPRLHAHPVPSRPSIAPTPTHSTPFPESM
ncbi:proline-rich protein 2-like [Eriocheir sinensis]|uniref:proline-rich protein 2-like n=1 Tax=Eriocheir sinensis TaxID=95602 RepID=UPI0021C72058|nr:proline-rich protein 2-like [Eriocheir sinensis]